MPLPCSGSNEGDSAEILIVGAPGVGRHTLAQRLVNHDAPSEAHAGNPDRWIIDTKYYTAEARLSLASCADEASLADARVAEALLLVLDACDPDSWTAARAWGEAADLDACSIRLCILNKADLLPVGTELPQLQEWCLDNQFEAIQVCCTDSDLDKELLWEGDMQGVPRVVQALQAHAWPGLQMKPRAVTAVSAAPPAQGPELQGADTASEADDTGVETASITATESARTEAALASLMGAMFSDAALEQDEEEEEEEEGLGLRELEAMMAKVAQQRSQVGSLTDEERREQAAALAMQMMKTMGLEDE